MRPSLRSLLLAVFLLTMRCSAEEEAVPSSRVDAGVLSREKFPEGFVFGTAASAYQVEGMALKEGRGPSIWDAFSRIPGEIKNNATASVTVDEYHRYKEDVDIMKNMNFDAYRFSISWSRIFPEGSGKVNMKGVAYYNRLINYMVQQGITPYANLYHYDLPEALEKRYKGLLDRNVVVKGIITGEISAEEVSMEGIAVREIRVEGIAVSEINVVAAPCIDPLHLVSLSALATIMRKISNVREIIVDAITNSPRLLQILPSSMSSPRLFQIQLSTRGHRRLLQITTTD